MYSLSTIPPLQCHQGSQSMGVINNIISVNRCHGRVGALKFLSYLRTRDPERILLYVDRGTFVF